MSEKISTIILKVDLHCSTCNKKIKKTLCKLQDRENIQSVTYDEKNNTVTITGPFDPKKLLKKICCKACKVIKDIQIVEEKPKPPPPAPEPAPPAPAPPAPEPAPPAPEPAPPAPEPCQPVPEPEPVPAPAPAPVPAPAPAPVPEPPKPDPGPQKVEPAPPAPEPVVKPPEPAHPYPYPVPVWKPGSGGCCCRPWFEAYYGGCRCCSCGWIYGPVSNCPHPPPTYVYGYGGQCCDGPKTCEFIWEEQPATCQIM